MVRRTTIYAQTETILANAAECGNSDVGGTVATILK